MRVRESTLSGRPGIDRVALLALPLACAAAWWAIAAYHREPPVAAEARYLGFLIGVVLLLALYAAPRIGVLQASVAVLLGAIPWALPGTPDRGAAVGVLLAGVLAIAAGSDSASSPLRPPKLVALMLGAQILARGGDLLAPSTATVIGVVAWAAVAAGAVLVLEARRGAFVAALAGASAFALGPGFTPMSALALAVPAAALLAADREWAPALRVAAVAALLAPLLWDYERGALLALGALAFAGPAWSRWTAGLAGLVAFFAPGAEQAAGLLGPAWLLVLLPILLTQPRAETATRFAALCLALGAAAQTPDRAALAVPAVLLAATVTGARKLPASLQVTWTGVLAGAVAVLAAYPWLRPHPLTDVTAILGLGDDWHAALVTLLLFAVAAAASSLLARTKAVAAPGELAPRAIALLLLPLALLGHGATESLPISRQPIQLDARSPAWSVLLEPPARVATLRLDSTLSNAAAIAPGTLVAEVLLATAEGERSVPVRAGLDTGEWAARRPDVGAIPGFTAPEPFLHWVDASGRFFGQRYRAREHLDHPTTATAVEVRLAPGLPPDLVLTLFHLELSR